MTSKISAPDTNHVESNSSNLSTVSYLSVRTTLSLHKSLHMEALRRGLSLQTLVNQVLEEWYNENSTKSVVTSGKNLPMPDSTTATSTSTTSQQTISRKPFTRKKK